MIGAAGARRAVMAIVIGLVVGVGFGLRSADPSRADPPLEAARRDGLAVAAARADEALASLGGVLAGAIGHARRGTALTVAGSAPPAPELEAAANALAVGADTADAARRAVDRLSGTAAAVAPGRRVPALSYGGPDLLLMAAGLRSGMDAATLFVERRHATQAVVGVLAEAAQALDANMPAAAMASLDRATAPLAILHAWTDAPPLFGYWLKVTRDLLDAARGIAIATIVGDPVGQHAAAERYAKAAVAARGADNALAVTLSEEGAAVSGIQLVRLANAAGAVADERAAVQALADAGS